MPPPKTTFTAQDYWALPEGARAYLIDGQLWNHVSPSRVHQEIVYAVGRMFGDYISSYGGSCKVYPAPFAVNLFADESTCRCAPG